jgi:hypothetical protein
LLQSFVQGEYRAGEDLPIVLVHVKTNNFAHVEKFLFTTVSSFFQRTPFREKQHSRKKEAVFLLVGDSPGFAEFVRRKFFEA